LPSPIGHGLGGIAAGWGVAPRRDRRVALLLAAAATAPDLDLLFGTHRAASHSLGAAAIAGAVAWAAMRRDRWRWSAAVTLAWASHVLLDWLSNDTRPPIGIMALWPFTDAYYKASVEIFPAVSRRYWESRFWMYNLRALVVELAVLGPITMAVLWWWRRRDA
jgi:membrane-bound metal-dependent hydrolase YbcI (DUF457 family)